MTNTVHAWVDKPTKEQLYEVLEKYSDQNRTDHVYEGGGRIYPEYQWYYLNEVENE